jgi:hypothetical protein
LTEKLLSTFKLVDVDKKISDAILGILDKLGQPENSVRSAFLGFDACIDYIVRLVREKNGSEVTDFFLDSNQFGEFLINLDNKSCGLELQTKLSKIGGNMVITGNALGNLGIKVECAGTFGIPDILPVFRSMSPNCSLHTIGDTITATALEFNNSKVIMFDPGPYNNLTWESIKEVLGTGFIKQLLSGKQLIAFVNWSEIENSTQIWKGFLDEILPDVILKGSKSVFFTDFSDCSRRSNEDIQAAIRLLTRFRNYFKVILSLNQNEAALIGKALSLNIDNSDEEFVRELYEAGNTDILVLHRTADAIAFDGRSFEKCDTFFCKEPRILTGGGDNFNAGFCFALLNNFTLFQSLLISNAVSGSYVKTGISPDLNSLMNFLQQNSKSINAD